MAKEKTQTKELFESKPIAYALATMAVPTVISQLITLFYNITDTWFIGRTNNPYMVAASSLGLTVFMIATALANLFGMSGIVWTQLIADGLNVVVSYIAYVKIMKGGLKVK